MFTEVCKLDENMRKTRRKLDENMRKPLFFNDLGNCGNFHFRREARQKYT